MINFRTYLTTWIDTKICVRSFRAPTLGEPTRIWEKKRKKKNHLHNLILAYWKVRIASTFAKLHVHQIIPTVNFPTGMQGALRCIILCIRLPAYLNAKTCFQGKVTCRCGTCDEWWSNIIWESPVQARVVSVGTAALIIFSFFFSSFFFTGCFRLYKKFSGVNSRVN